jgi:hypothetical protein
MLNLESILFEEVKLHQFIDHLLQNNTSLPEL